jgi:hypothetical protein
VGLAPLPARSRRARWRRWCTASSVPSHSHRRRWPCTVPRGGRSRGRCRHRQPVSGTWSGPFTTSRTTTERRRPPRLAGRISGAINVHSASVGSLGWRSPSRPYRSRSAAVHIARPLPSSAGILRQATQITSDVRGRALTLLCHVAPGSALVGPDHAEPVPWICPDRVAGRASWSGGSRRSSRRWRARSSGAGRRSTCTMDRKS